MDQDKTIGDLANDVKNSLDTVKDVKVSSILKVFFKAIHLLAKIGTLGLVGIALYGVVFITAKDSWDTNIDNMAVIVASLIACVIIGKWSKRKLK